MSDPVDTNTAPAAAVAAADEGDDFSLSLKKKKKKKPKVVADVSRRAFWPVAAALPVRRCVARALPRRPAVRTVARGRTRPRRHPQPTLLSLSRQSSRAVAPSHLLLSSLFLHRRPPPALTTSPRALMQ
jgi:hypothetical protein